jgi:DAACS family dicarboxylate/amino acid:cation (Na+ or H+) symporter
MLAVMFFALLFGIAMGTSSSARMGTLVAFMQGLYDVSLWLVGFAMRIAPVGVAALVFSVASRVGLDILLILAAYMATVLTGLAIHQLVVYSLVLRFACGLSPILFFRRVRPVMVTAFSTSSSNATLPTTIETARTRLGIPGKVANFVLTLGSTFNQNGTALFEGVSVIFIAQAYGVPLGMDQQLLVLGMAILAGVGTAGVPGGSIPMIVPVLVGIGVPAEGIFIILGVDRLLDMCRTVLNVTGDMVAAAFIARSEGALEVPPE